MFRILALNPKSSGISGIEVTDKLVLLFRPETSNWLIYEHLGVLKKLFKARVEEDKNDRKCTRDKGKERNTISQ